jgi:hypothetical protein
MRAAWPCLRAYKIYPFTLPNPAQFTPMHLNTDPAPPARKPCWRDLANLTATLLPPALVQLVPLKQLRRRVREINATHPHYREETPLVLAWEEQRRQRLSGQLAVAGRPLNSQEASLHPHSLSRA